VALAGALDHTRAAAMRGRIAAIALQAALLTVGLGSAPALAVGRVAGVKVAAAVNAAVKQAPSAPPLTTRLGFGTGLGVEEETASTGVGQGEPLAGNGLKSPLCEDAAEADLPAGAARDCELNGFEAAEAPSGDYAFDVHIDTGVAHPAGYLYVAFQELAQFGWTSLVTVVHGLVVLLDWCFTLDLLNGRAMGGVGRTLRATRAAFTDPWLAAMLAIASVMALYHGLIQRRVAQTIGEALLMLGMMAAGLLVIVDPVGTLGALGAWAEEAGLGTLGAVTAGTPSHPERALAEADRFVFATAIDGPWCYLEFADVGWCEAGLEPRLRSAGLAIAKRERAQIGCSSEVPEPVAKGLSEETRTELGIRLCAAKGSAQAKALERGAELLRDAKTNGDLFLALPANGQARNSINERWSLYRLLCGGGAEPCKGPTAAQAEARTKGGTGTRIVGLVFIGFGLLGMIMALGFIALRLLYAAVVSLICLLLTPAAVLAPALGEGGRGAFRAWATHLLGSVVSKLVFSLLLGAVLESERALSSVRVGWLTQWVLISAMWWIGFLNRHKVLGFARGEGTGARRPQSLAARARQAFDTPRTVLRHAGRARRWLARPGPDVERRQGLASAGRAQAAELADAQVARSLERELGEAQVLMGAAPELRAGISDGRTRLERLQAERAKAQAKATAAREARVAAAGDRSPVSPPERDRAVAAFAAEERSQRKRGASLQGRIEALRAKVSSEQGALTDVRRAVEDGKRSQRATGTPYTREQAERRARLLDAQAALPYAERDYAAIAGVAGYGRGGFEALDGPGQRAARLAIDRELAMRRELGGAAAGMVAGASGANGRRERRKARKDLERSLDERMRSEGHARPNTSGLAHRPAFARRLEAGRPAGATDERARRDGQEPRSPVMDDAREVAAKRKRQLGFGRP
jgi:hypothetical protein